VIFGVEPLVRVGGEQRALRGLDADALLVDALRREPGAELGGRPAARPVSAADVSTWPPSRYGSLRDEATPAATTSARIACVQAGSSSRLRPVPVARGRRPARPAGRARTRSPGAPRLQLRRARGCLSGGWAVRLCSMGCYQARRPHHDRSGRTRRANGGWRRAARSAAAEAVPAARGRRGSAAEQRSNVDPVDEAGGPAGPPALAEHRVLAPCRATRRVRPAPARARRVARCRTGPRGPVGRVAQLRRASCRPVVGRRSQVAHVWRGERRSPPAASEGSPRGQLARIAGRRVGGDRRC